MAPSKAPVGSGEQARSLPASTVPASTIGASIGSVTPGPPAPGTAATPVSPSGASGSVTSRVWAKTRLVVVAATAVTQGPVCATVLASGPLLPAAAATNTPAFVASRNANSTGSFHGSSDPEME